MMNKIALNLGYWAAVIAVAAFAAYTFCFIAILFVNPLFLWTDFEAYIRTVQTTNQSFKHIAMFFMLVYGACFVVQLCSIEEITEAPRKCYIKLAELFGVGFFTLIGINYFIQISAVRMQLAAGQTNGLEQFVQANPISGIAAVNMLGWTIFFGLSCVFAALAFEGGRIEKIIKFSLLANGVMMLISAVAYVFDLAIIVFLFMNIGMGAAVLTATVYLSKLFREKLKQSTI